MKTKLLFLNVAFMLCSLCGFSQFDVISLTGDGVGGWTNNPLASNFLTTTDGVTYTKQNFQITGSGSSAEVKFIKVVTPPSWDNTYGQAGGWPSGSATTTANIPAVAGFWNVTFNLTSKAYSFTPGVNPNPTINITNSGAAIAMTTTDGINYTAPSRTIVAGNFTFAQVGSSNVWGNPAFPTGTATAGGSPVVAPNGTYNISFNRNTGVYNFATTSVGMIGIGSPSGNWDNDTVMLTTNAVNYTLNNAVILVNGNMKIRDNGSWTFQFGANGVNTFPSATMIPNGGDFATLAGTYNITFNRSTGVINFSSTASTNSFVQENFNIMPNPSSTKWNITAKNNEITAIQIFDIVGKQVFNKNINALDFSIDATNFNKGVYIAKISTVEGSGTIKLVKN